MVSVRWAGLITPQGEVSVAVADGSVVALRFGSPPRPVSVDPVLTTAVQQLQEYFEGARLVFDLPLDVRGGSEFERAVWAQLTTIGYADMRTYGAIATALGDPGAARAVGTACNHNPIAIVLPCHRVVGAGGKLVGFGGGLPWKRYLLELEAKVRVEQTFAS
jgi:methylated-DNA-[protein]-cysteine S-methyltransferase